MVSQGKFSYLFSSCNFGNSLPCAGIRQSSVICHVVGVCAYGSMWYGGIRCREKGRATDTTHTLVSGFSSIAVRGRRRKFQWRIVCFCNNSASARGRACKGLDDDGAWVATFLLLFGFLPLVAPPTLDSWNLDGFGLPER